MHWDYHAFTISKSSIPILFPCQTSYDDLVDNLARTYASCCQFCQRIVTRSLFSVIFLEDDPIYATRIRDSHVINSGKETFNILSTSRKKSSVTPLPRLRSSFEYSTTFGRICMIKGRQSPNITHDLDISVGNASVNEVAALVIPLGRLAL